MSNPGRVERGCVLLATSIAAADMLASYHLRRQAGAAITTTALAVFVGFCHRLRTLSGRSRSHTMIHLLRSPHWRGTLLCLGAAAAALFLAQIPNDTKSDLFRSLQRPDFLPRELERKIGFIWTALFLLAGLGTAAALATDRPRRVKGLIVGLTLGMLALNLTYTFVFTQEHDLNAASWIAVALGGLIAATVAVATIHRLWLTAACQLPHFLWVSFAARVTWEMARLNAATPLS